MENYKDQPSEHTQPISPEDNLYPSSPQQRPSIRILLVTLLMGIMIGISLTFQAGNWYLITGSIPYAFYPTSPIIYRLLAPLAAISFGFVPFLGGIVLHLYKQHPAFRLRMLLDYNWPFISVIFGLFQIWLGSSQVILLCFAPDPYVWGTIEIIGFVVLTVTFFVGGLFLFMRNRHTP